MCSQAECSSFESALRGLAAVAACVGDALAGEEDVVSTETLRALRRGRAERRTATGAALEVAATAGAARCCAAQQQAAHCMQQPHCGEGAEAGACLRPGAAWGSGSAAGRHGESAQDGSGSVLPDSVRSSGRGGSGECGPAPKAPSGGKRAARDGVPGLAPGTAAGHSTPCACAAAAVPGNGWQAPQGARVGEDGSAQGAVLLDGLALDAGGGLTLTCRAAAPGVGQTARRDGVAGVTGEAASSDVCQAIGVESPAPWNSRTGAPGVVQPMPHAAAAGAAGGSAALGACQAARLGRPTPRDGRADALDARQAAQRARAPVDAGEARASARCQAAGANGTAPSDDQASTLGAQQARSRAGSAWGAAAWGVGQTAGVGGSRGRPGAGSKWRGVSQVREGGELCYAADIKRSKRCSQALHLGTFATGAPLLRPRMPSECAPVSCRSWQRAENMAQSRGGTYWGCI